MSGASSSTGAAGVTRLEGVRVLFVDDRRDTRFVVQHILRDAGAEVTSVENGLQALDAFCARACSGPSFDIVVMDIQMPVLDGLAATRRLRGQGCETPILALTAGAMEHDRRECLEAGCDDYLSKPIDGVALVERVNALAGR
jgi:CheY-like chemotaxis protein